MTGAPAQSPFAAASPALSGMGYSVIPLVPASLMRHAGRGKCPGTFAGGHWRGTDKWERHRDSPLEGFALGLALKSPDANAGIVLGTRARDDLFVMAVDVDVTNPDALDTIVRCLPASPMAKRGQKGLTLFYAAPRSIGSRSYDDHRIERGSGIPRRLVDVLTGFDTRQTVCPPSRHPEGAEYVWTTGPVPASELPVFDEDALEKLTDCLQQFGYDPSAARGGRGERKPYVPSESGDGGGDAFDVAKRAALANIGAWIRDLENVARLRPARGGFECVSLMRDSSTGQPTERRKRSLSIQPNGITDFGTGDTFSAVDLVAHHNGLSIGGALSWLEDRLGLSGDEDVVIDLEAFRASCVEKGTAPPPVPDAVVSGGGASVVTEKAVATMPKAEADETHGEFPAHLLDCPGVVGDLAAWMTRTAPRPLPAANLLTALAMVGTAAGRRFCGPTESGTAIYGLALAPSGSGKAHPIRAAQHIMRKAGLAMMIAPSSWMSGSALIQHLGRQPCCMTQADEVGEFFAKLNGAKASPHERAISGVIRELFGINWGSYTTPGWANSNSAATTPPVIHAPAYSFIGYSVPEAVWEAMQGADVTNGMLNRFLLVPSLVAGVEQDDPESVFDVPDSLVASLRAIAEVGGPLASATMHSDMATEPLCRVQFEGGKTGDAAALFRELRRYCQEHPAGEHLMKRTAEIAIRLATVRAIGRDGQRAAVTLPDMDWGRNVALFSADRMIHDAAAYMSETEWQQKALGILRIIREAPGGVITKTKLYQRLNHKYKSAEVKAIIEGLQETGQVSQNSVRVGERGPASVTYRAA